MPGWGAHGPTKEEEGHGSRNGHARALLCACDSRAAPAGAKAADAEEAGARDAARTARKKGAEAGAGDAHGQGVREAVRPRVGGRPPDAA